MTEARCAYEGCSERVNTPHHQTLCIFHSPAEMKGEELSVFNKRIWERINKNNYNFKGFIFPGKIYFRGECSEKGGPIEINGNADFSDAKFTDDADFWKTKFGYDAYFTGTRFKNKADFYRTQFIGIAYFKDTRFLGEVHFGTAIFTGHAIFDNAVFTKVVYFGRSIDPKYLLIDIVIFSGNASFYETKFLENAIFNGVNFPNEAQFINAKFSGNSEFVASHFERMADFSGAIFQEGANFNTSEFYGQVAFINNIIGSTMSFYNVRFSDKTVFYFINSKTLKGGDNKSITVLFERIRFIPFSTYFEHVRLSQKSPVIIFIFRYCQLENVYFTNNDMSLFSFYKSSFELAQFISCEWSYLKDKILFIPFKRKNILPEEKFLSGTVTKDDFKAGDLNSYEDVASLYRRMKTSLDNAKDYQQASLFYFNEFEMKRWALQVKFEIELQKRIFVSKTLSNVIGHFFRKSCSKLPFYNLYKIFAGYGEKPLWSFLWMILFSSIFAILHLFSGLDPVGMSSSPPTIHLGKYSTLSQYISWDLIRDFASSFIFSISRAIPVNYLGVSPSGYWDSGTYGQSITFFNSIILLTLVIFMGIGLKRHFRRF